MNRCLGHDGVVKESALSKSFPLDKKKGTPSQEAEKGGQKGR